jgi:hypothetical protein
MELDLSFCFMNQADRMSIADVWKNTTDREAIVQDSICILGTVQN